MFIIRRSKIELYNNNNDREVVSVIIVLGSLTTGRSSGDSRASLASSHCSLLLDKVTELSLRKRQHYEIRTRSGRL